MAEAFNRLLEGEVPRLVRMARSLWRHDPRRAPDLVQECLCRAVSRQHLWQPGTNLQAWLTTIMHNQYVNEVRHSVREGAPVLIDEDVVRAQARLHMMPGALPVLELRDLRRGLMKLPVGQRQVVLLIGIDGIRYQDAARLLGLPVGTVRSRLSRGRAALRGLVEEGKIPKQARAGRPSAQKAAHPARLTKQVSCELDRITAALAGADAAAGGRTPHAGVREPLAPLIPEPTRAILVKEIARPGQNSYTRIFRVIA